VGSDGTIVRTTNGGQLWMGVPSGTEQRLQALVELTASQIVAVGDSGTILRSEDGGEHWVTHDPLTHHHLKGISIIPSGSGIAVGDSGTVLCTSDGGQHWSTLPGLGDVQLRAVYMLSDIVVLVAGGGPGWVFRSTDGGQSWSQTINDTLGEVTSLSFCDTSNGMASAGNHILITSDGGRSWQVRAMDAQCYALDVHMISRTMAFAAGSLQRWMGGPCHGGYMPFCELFRSTDGGATWDGQFFYGDGSSEAILPAGCAKWNSQILNTMEGWGVTPYGSLTSIDFDKSNNGTAVGPNGLIIRTTNAGTSWANGRTDQQLFPIEPRLLQNYPNPFNPSTVVSYQLPVVSRVDLRVFDLLGREVAVLVNEEKPPGSYTMTWDASDLPSGVYFCRLTAGGFSQIRKAVLLR
jgi:photosystem II stability/assembly factor-like uncharacterized protein